MKETNKNNWTENVLSSLEGKRRVPTPDFLFNKIEDELFSKVVSIGWVMKWAAAAIVILGLNIYAVQQSNTNLENIAETTHQQSNVLTYDYNLYE